MPETMLAARLGAREFSLEEIPVPSIGPTDCLVAAGADGICGSDLHIIEGRTPVPYRPIALAHEPAGVVVAVGEGVRRVARERVFVNPIVTCGTSRTCRLGRTHICAERALDTACSRTR